MSINLQPSATLSSYTKTLLEGIVELSAQSESKQIGGLKFLDGKSTTASKVTQTMLEGLLADPKLSVELTVALLQDAIYGTTLAFCAREKLFDKNPGLNRTWQSSGNEEFVLTKVDSLAAEVARKLQEDGLLPKEKRERLTRE